MKKLLLAMMAILALVAARPVTASAADWYFVGGPNSSWTVTDEWGFDKKSDGIYTKKISDFAGGFKIHDGSNWKNSFGSNGENLKLGEIYNAGTDGDNIAIDSDSFTNVTDVLITINTTDHSILITKDGSDEPQPDTRDMYYKSSGQGWGSTKMKSGENYTWTYEVTGSDEFVIVADDTEELKHNEATTTVIFDTPYLLYKKMGDNHNFKIDGTAKYTVTVDASNKDAMTVTVSKGGEGPQPTITYTLWSNINSSDNGPWSSIDFDRNSNGKWEKDVENVNGKSFVIKDSDGKEYKPAQATNIYAAIVTETVAVREGETSGQDFIFKADGKYTITLDASNASNLTVTVTPVRSGDQHVDKWPANPEKFVYFNAGFAWERADRINKGKIYAHFIKKGEDIKEPADGDWRFEMKDNREVEGNTNAMLPLFYAPVPENYQDYDGVQFEAENGIVYNTKKCSDYKKYDSEHWFDFIFTADNSVDGIGKVFSAEQSVMTYEQYRVRRDDPNKEALYYLGTNIQGRDGLSNSAVWYETDFSGKVGISQASEGVFMFQLKPTDSKADIKFKMSWVNANKRTKDYNTEYNRTGNAELTGGDKRWWATYNLGLVGPTLAPTYNGDLKAAQEAGDYEPATGIDGNAAMKYIPRRCRKYSRYCSYDWWIGHDKIEDGTYYVIVDTYYKTTALIKYEPKPTLSSLTEDAPRKNETPFSDEDAARYGSQLKGAQVHGTTLVKYANTVSGNATIKPSANISELWRENDYQLEYGIYYKIDGTQDESTIISKFNGLKEAERYSIEMDNLPYGKNVQVGVRCTYTDNINNKGDYVAKFRSFTNWKETTNTQQTAVVEASVSQPTAVRFLDNNLWHATASATINVTTSGDLAYYIDIDPDKNNREHPVRFAEASDFQVQANIGNYHYKASDNNWADPRNGGNIDFVIDNIEDPTSTSYYDATFTVQVPYIVGDLTPTVKYSTEAEGEDNWTDLPAAASVRRRANDAASAIRVDFAPVDVIATVKDMALSGINDVMADGDAEAEYFNLQGVRVRGDIVPGVYIVRRGATVTKEIVK